MHASGAHSSHTSAEAGSVDGDRHGRLRPSPVTAWLDRAR